LNSQLEVPLSDFKRLTDTLAVAREQYRQVMDYIALTDLIFHAYYFQLKVNGGVTERSRLLSQIADELESVKAEMEDRGSSMTDGSPLVNIRKTLTRMKQEVISKT